MHDISTYLGATLVLIGILLLVSPTIGFETIAAERSTTIDTADDANALLGIESTGATPSNQYDVNVVEISNNAQDDFVTLETDVTLDDPNGALAVSDPFATSLASGASTGLELTCQGGGGGTATVTVDTTASASSFEIRDHTYIHTFDYSCTGNGAPPAAFQASDVGEVDGVWTQTFRFDGRGFGNKETATIGLNEAESNTGINYTNASAEVTNMDDKRADVSYDATTGQIQFATQSGGQIPETIEIELTGFDVSGDGGLTTAYYDDSIDEGRADDDDFTVPGVGTGNSNDDVESSGDVLINEGATVNHVDAGGDVEIQNGATVNSGINAEGSVIIQQESYISGGIQSGGTVTLDPTEETSYLNGGIDAGGDVIVNGNWGVSNGIVSDGEVYCGDGAYVNGEIDAADGHNC